MPFLPCEGALNAVRNATRRNQNVLVETCIQYLVLDASLYEKNFDGAKWVMVEQRKGDEYLNWKEFQKRGLPLNDH